MQVRSAADWSLCLPFMAGCWLSLRARLLIGSFAQVCLEEKTYLKLSLGESQVQKRTSWTWTGIGMGSGLYCFRPVWCCVSKFVWHMFWVFTLHTPLLKEKAAIWGWGAHLWPQHPGSWEEDHEFETSLAAVQADLHSKNLPLGRKKGVSYSACLSSERLLR